MDGGSIEPRALAVGISEASTRSCRCLDGVAWPALGIGRRVGPHSRPLLVSIDWLSPRLWIVRSNAWQEDGVRFGWPAGLILTRTVS